MTQEVKKMTKEALEMRFNQSQLVNSTNIRIYKCAKEAQRKMVSTICKLNKTDSRIESAP